MMKVTAATSTINFKAVSLFLCSEKIMPFVSKCISVLQVLQKTRWFDVSLCAISVLGHLQRANKKFGQTYSIGLRALPSHQQDFLHKNGALIWTCVLRLPDSDQLLQKFMDVLLDTTQRMSLTGRICYWTRGRKWAEIRHTLQLTLSDVASAGYLITGAFSGHSHCQCSSRECTALLVSTHAPQWERKRKVLRDLRAKHLY